MDYVLLVGLLLSWSLLIVLALVVYQLILQSGRLLLRIDDIEEWLSLRAEDPHKVDDYVDTLPVGIPAPAIDLPDLNGTIRSMAEWRGKRVLLVFVDPECAFSRRLLTFLAGFDADPVPDRPVPLLISAGDMASNRALFDEAGFRHTVLLQTETEVAAAYKVDGTPMSYLIEPDGTLGSELATGVQATLILAGEPATALEDDRGPVASAVTNRDGLQKGLTAPVFRLPKVGGGEVTLLEYRGKDVLVVFFDPECRPCEELAPRLNLAIRERPDLSIVVVSKGDVGANQGMVRDWGLIMPVALQRQWEISRDYGIFSTPAGFHVDEWGIIAADVAVGPDAILALVASDGPKPE